MTDNAGQKNNDDKGYDAKTNKSTRKRPSIKSYLIDKTPITFPQYPLYACGFLRGRNTKINIISTELAKEFLIGPYVDGKFFDGDPSEKKVEFKPCDKLYIEVSGLRYIVSWSQQSYNHVLIHSVDHFGKDPIVLAVECNNSKNNSLATSYCLGDSSSSSSSSFIDIFGKKITVRLSEEHCTLSNTVYWQIPIIYILNDVMVKRGEDLLSKMISLREEKSWWYCFLSPICNLKKAFSWICSKCNKLYRFFSTKRESIFNQLLNQNNIKRMIICFFSTICRVIKFVLGISSKYDKIYCSYMELRLKYCSPMPIDITSSRIAGKIWEILSEHYKIEKRFEYCCSLIELNQNAQIEIRNRYLTCLAVLFSGLCVVSAVNDGWELLDKIFGSDSLKPIVSIFMPGSV